MGGRLGVVVSLIPSASTLCQLLALGLPPDFLGTVESLACSSNPYRNINFSDRLILCDDEGRHCWPSSWQLPPCLVGSLLPCCLLLVSLRETEGFEMKGGRCRD